MIACRISAATIVRFGSLYEPVKGLSKAPLAKNKLYASWSARWIDMPTSCSSAPPATTTSASRADIPWSATTAGSSPALTSRRSSRKAMFRHDLGMHPGVIGHSQPFACTCAMYHQVRTCSSSLTASQEALELPISPRRGPHLRLSYRLLGRLAARPLRVGRGNNLVTHTSNRRKGVGRPLAGTCELANLRALAPSIRRGFRPRGRPTPSLNNTTRRPARGWIRTERRAGLRGSPALVRGLLRGRPSAD